MERLQAPVHIAGWDFDHASYDAVGDVLYLSIGEPRTGYAERTPEGHLLAFDDNDAFCGVTLVSVRTLLERGALRVTLPGVPVSRAEIGPALVVA